MTKISFYFYSYSSSCRNGDFGRITRGISWNRPSGRYLRIVKGSILLINSCSAIIIGSRTSSESIRIGAPIESCKALAPMIRLFSYFVRCPGPTFISFGEAGILIRNCLCCSATIVTEGNTKLKIGLKNIKPTIRNSLKKLSFSAG